MRTKSTILRDLLGTAILHVRSGSADSRCALAPALGLSRSTVGVYVEQLIARGYVDELGLEHGPVGRPKRKLTTRADAGWFAGIEFNAERMQIVRIDFAGRRVASQSRVLPDGVSARTVLQMIHSGVTTLAKNGDTSLLAIGVGAPGLVDPRTGISSSYRYISEWSNVPISRILGERFEVPIVLENNLRTIAMAERWFGSGRNLTDYVILGPRAGFGVAVVQNGTLVRGVRHGAGEIGRWRWPLGAAEGKELQEAVSASAVWRRLSGNSRSKLPQDLRAALADFANSNGTAWDEVVRDFAYVIGALQLLVDTDVFFLHGPLTALGERFCEEIQNAARASTPMLAEGHLKIFRSALGDDAGALGAASMAMEAWAPVLRS